MTNRRYRDLSSEEYQLWNRVKQTATPLHKDHLSSKHEPDTTGQPSKSGSKTPLYQVTVSGAARPAGKTRHPATLDRRTSRRLRRGKAHIEAKLDLHGQTQGAAHQALHAFLHASRRKGAGFVLVITGKSGVLNRLVPLWLNEPSLRCHVSAISPAAPRHGGHGALYVRLRRL